MILSADTNLFLYAAKPQSPYHAAARRFFEVQAEGSERFLLCGLVLVEIYMQLRNPAVFRRLRAGPKSAVMRTIITGRSGQHQESEGKKMDGQKHELAEGYITAFGTSVFGTGNSHARATGEIVIG